MSRQVDLSAVVPEAMAGQRLDQVLAELFPEYSRSRLQQWIRSGEARIDGAPRKAKDRLLGGERVVIGATLEEDTRCLPQFACIVRGIVGAGKRNRDAGVVKYGRVIQPRTQLVKVARQVLQGVEHYRNTGLGQFFMHPVNIS